MISEVDTIKRVLSLHGVGHAEKFISEIFWRTYWKGWLEQRSSLWLDYERLVEREMQSLEADGARSRRYRDATDARTGIDCFDGWTKELLSTGYLHNWSRMQFASIWIFTLGLPWALGAEFMRLHLIDGDPASNTLSWRWVAGLHTIGKAYLADAEKIKAMTNGRFAPVGLARQARIPIEEIVVPAPSSPRPAPPVDEKVESLLLLSVEDLSLETLPELSGLQVSAIAYLSGTDPYDSAALDDAVLRAQARWPNAERLGVYSDATTAAARAQGCRQVVTGFVTVGPTVPHAETVRRSAEQHQMIWTEHVRAWDRQAWPHCRKGFFALKEKIPALLRSAGLTA
ncbi:FAD-binding domain-containing protein [Rhizobium sp. AAP43]|uniref:FAD-binding domain-containing protein n=1 Tax=Rhizobium sp. AAP43 TaxID=1523420 RepID=UPI000ACB6885|nr:FAD-binding domain-containing protein [Rhizobium sp. AAP43]